MHILSLWIIKSLFQIDKGTINLLYCIIDFYFNEQTKEQLSFLQFFGKQEAHGPLRSPPRCTLISCQKGSYLHINSPIIDWINHGRGKLQNNMFKHKIGIKGHIIKTVFLSLSEPSFEVRKKFLKVIMHFHYMTYMAAPWHKTPCPGGH